jgi:hypothetical protein
VMQPSGQPTTQPTTQPSQPTGQPSGEPTRYLDGGGPSYTRLPTGQPSRQPTGQPTMQPSRQPTSQPSSQPSRQPASCPTSQPSRQPSSRPTVPRVPSYVPSPFPSRQPTAPAPTKAPAMVVTQTVGLTLGGGISVADVNDAVKASLRRAMASILGIDVSQVSEPVVTAVARRLGGDGRGDEAQRQRQGQGQGQGQRRLGSGVQVSFVVQTITTSGSSAAGAAATTDLLQSSTAAFVAFVVSDLASTQQGLPDGVSLTVAGVSVIDLTPTYSPTQSPVAPPTLLTTTNIIILSSSVGGGLILLATFAAVFYFRQAIADELKKMRVSKKQAALDRVWSSFGGPGGGAGDDFEDFGLAGRYEEKAPTFAEENPYLKSTSPPAARTKGASPLSLPPVPAPVPARRQQQQLVALSSSRLGDWPTPPSPASPSSPASSFRLRQQQQQEGRSALTTPTSSLQLTPASPRTGSPLGLSRPPFTPPASASALGSGSGSRARSPGSPTLSSPGVRGQASPSPGASAGTGAQSPQGPRSLARGPVGRGGRGGGAR